MCVEQVAMPAPPWTFYLDFTGKTHQLSLDFLERFFSLNMRRMTWRRWGWSLWLTNEGLVMFVIPWQIMCQYLSCKYAPLLSHTPLPFEMLQSQAYPSFSRSHIWWLHSVCKKDINPLANSSWRVLRQVEIGRIAAGAAVNCKHSHSLGVEGGCFIVKTGKWLKEMCQ